LFVTERYLLWALCIVMPSVCTIRAEMILDPRSRFSITISEKIVRISTCCFLIHAKVSIFREMIIVLLEHRHLVRYCNTKMFFITIILTVVSLEYTIGSVFSAIDHALSSN
jgi:hypothetical protein